MIEPAALSMLQAFLNAEGRKSSQFVVLFANENIYGRYIYVQICRLAALIMP